MKYQNSRKYTSIAKNVQMTKEVRSLPNEILQERYTHCASDGYKMAAIMLGCELGRRKRLAKVKLDMENAAQ